VSKYDHEKKKENPDERKTEVQRMIWKQMEAKRVRNEGKSAPKMGGYP